MQPSGTFTTELMASGIQQLDYIIYTDNSYAQAWGDGMAGTAVKSDSYTLTTSWTSRSYPMYGRIPAGQNRVVPGVYGSNITVTLAY